MYILLLPAVQSMNLFLLKFGPFCMKSAQISAFEANMMCWIQVEWFGIYRKNTCGFLNSGPQKLGNKICL